jgi:hypothetical protein
MLLEVDVVVFIRFLQVSLFSILFFASSFSKNQNLFGSVCLSFARSKFISNPNIIRIIESVTKATAHQTAEAAETEQSKQKQP